MENNALLLASKWKEEECIHSLGSVSYRNTSASICTLHMLRYECVIATKISTSISLHSHTKNQTHAYTTAHNARVLPNVKAVLRIHFIRLYYSLVAWSNCKPHSSRSGNRTIRIAKKPLMTFSASALPTQPKSLACVAKMHFAIDLFNCFYFFTSSC